MKFLSQLFGGNKSTKDINQLYPVVDKINTYFNSYQSLDNDDLRAKSDVLKKRIATFLAPIDEKIATLTASIEEKGNSDHALGEVEGLIKQKKALQKERNSETEKILWEILPEAFALIKEVARRFSENTSLTATANELDKKLANEKSYISISGDKATYQNTWDVAGNPITWNMVHFDVQLLGGIILHKGKIAEMATGEGKTLVSTLPAYLNALAGNGVHIVTVNEYLARRDSEWNAPLFEWLGVTVGCIDKYQPHSEGRKQAYQCGITYGTNNEFGFDYLRDNMVREKAELTQGQHYFAIIDEVDSVLIDDARTPLIISGPVASANDELVYIQLKPRIAALVEAQKQLVQNYLIDAKQKLQAGDESPTGVGLDLMRVYKGLPQYTPFIKLLSEPGVKVRLQKAENYYLENQQKEMVKVEQNLYFVIDEKNKSVVFTDKGLHYLAKDGEDKSMFILPDISIELSRIDKDPNLSNEQKQEQKEAIVDEYAQKSDRLHSIQQLLKAYTLFRKDVEYVVINQQVKIVDEQTGRIMEGRRYSDGLHQALEAKENVNVEASSQTYATISLQNYFRMYFKLSGMTGTAETESAEFWDIYKLDVTVIPTHRKVIRDDKDDLIFKTKREKYNAVIKSVEENIAAGRPTLVGTTSVETSELISKMLTTRKIPHNVLNAKQHAKEANIVAEAGNPSAVTIATNMAGRGTDIKLGVGVKESGGLMIIGTERHESRRVDRQLRGRAGRQGDPGGSQFFVSLEDDLMRLFGSERIAKWMDRFGLKEGEVIQHSMVTSSITRAQKKVEENNFGSRKRLLDYDDVMNKQRSVIYEKRRHALEGEQLRIDIDNAFYAITKQYADEFLDTQDKKHFEFQCLMTFGLDPLHLVENTNHKNSLADELYDLVIEKYNHAKTEITSTLLPIFRRMALIHANQPNAVVVVPYASQKHTIQVPTLLHKALASDGKSVILELEKSIMLSLIDNMWKEHLRNMENLRQSVQTAYLEQKDPLVIYKIESYNLFESSTSDLNQKLVSFLVHAGVIQRNEDNIPVQSAPQKNTLPKSVASRSETTSPSATESRESSDEQVEKKEPVRVEKRVGRNDPCPCGSGKKYKNCHG